MAKVRGTPEVGDIVQVPVPREVQRDKGYPSAVVHRIIEIKDGRVITQGDNLDSPDPFDAPLSAIDREMLTVVPGHGRMVSFVTSQFGLLGSGPGVSGSCNFPRSESQRCGERRVSVVANRIADTS